jgi:hypothetical protein
MPVPREPRLHRAAPEFYYRRHLSARELLPAIGVGVSAGLAAFYIARLFLQRTPLAPALPVHSPRNRSAPSPNSGG